MKKGTSILICVLLALIATGVTLYPLVSNIVSETNRSLIETQYIKAVEKLDDSEIVEARTQAQSYNATLLAVTEKPYTREEAPVEEAPLSTWTEDYLKGISYGLVGVASLTTAIGILWPKPKRKKKTRPAAGSRNATPAAARHSDNRRSHIHWESVSIQSAPRSAVQKTRSRKRRLRLFPERKRPDLLRISPPPGAKTI